MLLDIFYTTWNSGLDALQLIFFKERLAQFATQLICSAETLIWISDSYLFQGNSIDFFDTSELSFTNRCQFSTKTSDPSCYLFQWNSSIYCISASSYISQQPCSWYQTASFCNGNPSLHIRQHLSFMKTLVLIKQLLCYTEALVFIQTTPLFYGTPCLDISQLIFFTET
jgi:hypothetical protein